MSYEKIFEYDLAITGVTDYGADMEALFTRRESVPLQGAQFGASACLIVYGSSGGRTRWAHFEFTRINIEPSIRRKKIEEFSAAGCVHGSSGPRSRTTRET